MSNSEFSKSLVAESGDRILLVDDDAAVCTSLRLVLERAGYNVTVANNARSALDAFSDSQFNLLLCDFKLPGTDGKALLAELQAKGSLPTVVMMSAFGNAQLALDVIKAGAYDFVAKPFEPEEILLTLKKARERDRLRAENEMLRLQVSRRYSFANIVAKSQSMLSIFETVKKIAEYRTTVMIHGESGTGKELIAKAIHFNSARKNKRFIAINCGAIPENLLESELFGHKRGAFTDATKDKKGLFEEAEGGTLLLDEVGELPLHLQVKLLRVLQENEIRPVGDTRVIPIDVRIIAATLRDLEQDVLDGRFRDDLFYRLNIITVSIPPLRERKEDIPLLVNHLIKKHREKLGLPVFGVTKGALGRMIEHSWPGNIRELENCIERSMILTDGEEITEESLPGTLRVSAAHTGAPQLGEDELSIKVHSRAMEESLIRKALHKTKGNRTHAARLLEISHRTLLYKLKEYNLAEPGEGDS